MAKRKRLTPANPVFLEAPETRTGLSAPVGAAPIADVAREASATAAAEEMARTLTEARTGGRMVISVPLEAIELTYLVRDRLVVQDEEMQALKDSLRNRGQQTPVELVALDGGRYGLISGWRRCTALGQLAAETGEARFASVQALLRQPAEASEAYVAMVEENEIRVGLSYYERARIAAKAVERGVFASEREALQTLFQSASRARRSKIGSFLGIVAALDGALRFPAAIPERLGLALAKALAEQSGLADDLRDTLALTAPESPEAERACLEAALARTSAAEAPAPAKAAPSQETPAATPLLPGLTLERRKGRLVLSGPAVDDALEARLRDWLQGGA